MIEDSKKEYQYIDIDIIISIIIPIGYMLKRVQTYGIFACIIDM